VIADLDAALKALLERELPDAIASATSISFETPDADFPAGGVTLPAIDLFLYDVRENTELRSNEWLVERTASDELLRHAPPTRVACSYLVTAWGSGTSPARDEHRLLSEVLKVLVRFPAMPPELLNGELAGQTPAVSLARLGPGPLESATALWQALGGKPRAGVNVTVTVGVPTAPPEDAGPPVREPVVDVRQIR
jgi:Pvc16 N-terminal domain